MAVENVNDGTVHLPIIRPTVIYRCRKCGTLAYGHQILPSDDLPPRDDCPCYMGPRWVRGVWFAEPE